MAVGAARQTVRETSFEVYLERDGRWLVQGVFTSRDQALAFGHGLAERKDLQRGPRDPGDLKRRRRRKPGVGDLRHRNEATAGGFAYPWARSA